MTPTVDQVSMAYVGINPGKRGLNVMEWRWLCVYAHVSLEMGKPAYVADSCVWFNEL